MLGVSAAFNAALAKVAGALALKIGVINLLTVRSRLLTGDSTTGKPLGKNFEEELAMPQWVGMFFSISLGAVGPTFSTERFVGLVNNAKENEPFFLCMAAAIAIAGTAPSWGVSALYYYLWSRIGHAIIYLVDFPAPLVPYKVLARASAYLFGVFSMFALAGSQFA